MRQDLERPLRVLVVDDSAVVRTALTLVLEKMADMQVVTAADPLIAQRKLETARPDVIVLDMQMPRMDGLSFLHSLAGTDAPPVVVCSAVAGPGTALAIQALQAGAVDVVGKPNLGRGADPEATLDLVQVLQAAVRVRRRPQPPRAAPQVSRRPMAAALPGLPARHVVAMGASTGGTEAIRTILQALPSDAPATVIVQHMPEGFTAAFARNLDEVCAVAVKEAESGDLLQRGRVLLARGNRHLEVRGQPGQFRVELTDGPRVSGHRPSVDVLFESVARVAQDAAMGVLLTGMGADGAQGLLAMRRAGAMTVAQDEASSVVYGMPKEAVKLGAVERQLSPEACAALVSHFGS